MSLNEEQRLQEQLAAYALGSLDLEDMIEVERQIADSPEARTELDQLRGVVGMLSFAAPPVEPPDRVRQQLMSRIRASQPQPPVANATTAGPPARPSRFGRGFGSALTAMLAVLVLVLGGLTLSMQQTMNQLATRNGELQAQVQTLDQSLATIQGRQAELENQLADTEQTLGVLNQQVLSDQQNIQQLNASLMQDQYIISFISAPGVATRDLESVEALVASRGEMYMYPGHSTAVVLFSDMPQLRQGQVYQFWLADGTTQVAAGTFDVSHDGFARLLVEAPREVNAFAEVMVTIEPDGGSTTPSSTVILEGSL
jgi:anti-sigma-K factor RskA